MPLVVNYSPVGALVAAAAGSGQAEAQRTNFAEGMQLADFSQRAQQQNYNQMAQDRAFQLQKAYALRTQAEQQKSPIADHFADHLALENQQKQAEQNQYKAHLDDMLKKGFINEQQYAQAWGGVLSGSKGLIDSALAPTEKGDPMKRPIFEAQLSQLREQRQARYSQLKEIQAAKLDPLKASSVVAGSEETLQQQIDQSYQDEHNLIMSANGGKKTVAPQQSQGYVTISGPQGPMTFGSQTPATPATPAFAGQAAAGVPEGFIGSHGPTGTKWIVKGGKWAPFGEQQATPQATPQAMPQATPQATPQAMPQPDVWDTYYEGDTNGRKMRRNRRTGEVQDITPTQLTQPTQPTYQSYGGRSMPAM